MRRSATVLLIAALMGPLVLILTFRFVNPPTTSLILLRRWEGLGTAQDWLPYDAIPTRLREAAVEAEDPRFCFEQFGFDWGAIKSQLKVWLRGGRPTGASTITMQTARTIFLWPDRSWLRKLLEAWLTPQIALLWPHQRVMELYLNVAEFGPGIYGVAAAAKAFWGRPVGKLSLEDSALLMTVLPAPNLWSVNRPSSTMMERAHALSALVAGQGRSLDCVGHVRQAGGSSG